MEKGNKRKKEIQTALKELACQKGYANVTMKDIGQAVGLSVGGLYHHYHSVEEIFRDLISSETGSVWGLFQDVTDFDSLMRSINAYLEQEKKELLSATISVNNQWYQYYFSFPDEQRRSIMKKEHDETISIILNIFNPVYQNEDVSLFLAEHIFMVLQGLTILSLGNTIHEGIIDREFSMFRELLENTYRKEMGE